MHSIGTPRPSTFETPSRTAVCVSVTGYLRVPLPGIGVTAVWPRHRPVIPTSRQPPNIPNQRYGAVGSPVVYDGEEVTYVRPSSAVGHRRRVQSSHSASDDWWEWNGHRCYLQIDPNRSGGVHTPRGQTPVTDRSCRFQRPCDRYLDGLSVLQLNRGVTVLQQQLNGCCPTGH